MNDDDDEPSSMITRCPLCTEPLRLVAGRMLRWQRPGFSGYCRDCDLIAINLDCDLIAINLDTRAEKEDE